MNVWAFVKIIKLHAYSALNNVSYGKHLAHFFQCFFFISLSVFFLINFAASLFASNKTRLCMSTVESVFFNIVHNSMTSLLNKHN